MKPTPAGIVGQHYDSELNDALHPSSGAANDRASTERFEYGHRGRSRTAPPLP